MKTLSIIAFVLSFSSLANAYHGNTLVTCVDPKDKKNPVVVSYTIQGTESGRLGGDVTIEGQVISSFQVAQYKAFDRELFLLIDDALTNTKPLYTFEAKIEKNWFEGKLIKYVNGKNSKKSVKCKLSQQ